MASSVGRKIEAIIENQGYAKALDKVVEVNESLSTYTLEFVYDMDTDRNMKLNFCLGAVVGQDTSIESHIVTLDNFYLYEIFVKENGEYVNIDNEDKWTYNTNWGHFWDGPGGCWFNPVTETTNIKLVSKSNPDIFIEYILNVATDSATLLNDVQTSTNVETKARTLSNVNTINNVVPESVVAEVSYSVNGQDKGSHTMITDGNKYSLVVGDLKNGDTVSYKLKITVDGVERIIEGSEDYVHEVANEGNDDDGSEDDGSEDDNSGVVVDPDEDNNNESKEENLPQTGGRSTLPVVALGVVLTTVGVIVLRKRKEA